MMHADRLIPGWFQEINRNHLIWLMRTHEIEVVLEVGAFLGKSTVFFAGRCHRVYSVDYWKLDCLSEDERRFAEANGLPGDFRAVWEDNITQAHDQCGGYASFADTFPVDPSAPVSVFQDDLPDLVYIDGNHSFEAVQSDIARYGALAQKIICGDDYGAAEGVTRAVYEAFAAEPQSPEANVYARPRLQIAPPFWWVVL